jgi:hypothetical protein
MKFVPLGSEAAHQGELHGAVAKLIYFDIELALKKAIDA